MHIIIDEKKIGDIRVWYEINIPANTAIIKFWMVDCGEIGSMRLYADNANATLIKPISGDEGDESKFYVEVTFHPLAGGRVGSIIINHIEYLKTAMDSMVLAEWTEAGPTS